MSHYPPPPPPPPSHYPGPPSGPPPASPPSSSPPPPPPPSSPSSPPRPVPIQRPMSSPHSDSDGPSPSSSRLSSASPPSSPSPPYITDRARTRSKLHRGSSDRTLSLGAPPPALASGDPESPSRRHSSRDLSSGLVAIPKSGGAAGAAAAAGGTPVGSPAAVSKIQRLAGAAPSRHNLREVRCEGWLQKKNSSGLSGMRGWTRRFFVLFPHSLCYWSSQKDSESKPPKGKFDSQKIARVVQDEHKASERFDVYCTDGRIIELKASTAEDAAFWVESLPGEKATAASSGKSMAEIMAELSKNQPDDGELNKQFEAFMEEKCFKPDARARMRLLPSQQKWLLLCQEQAKSGSGRKGPEHWIRLLRAPKVAAKDIETLKVAISGSGKSWMNSFVQIGGLAALLSLLNRDTAAGGLAQLALDCLKAFMNNEFGLNVMLSTSHAIEQIALVLTFGDEQMCMQVIDLLLVTCWLSEDGHKSVMDALDNPRFQRRFKVLTEFLARGENAQFKAKVLTFINALINALNALDERIYTRTEFMDLGMTDIIENLRKWVDKNRGVAGFEVYDQIRNQLDIFEEETINDRREATQNGLDLSDMDAVLAFMRDNFQNSGQSAHFLSALQHLMLVPADKYLGAKMWTHVNHILDHATHLVENEEADDEEDAYHVLSMERLKELLAEREKQSVIEEKNHLREMEKEAEQLRTKLHDQQMKEQQHINEIRDLKEKLAQALAGQAVAVNPGDLPPAGDVPAAPGLDVPAAPDAPPLDGVPGAPDAPPLDGIPAAPDAPDIGAPGDIPMAPDFGPTAFVSDSGPKLPKKRVIKPDVKMKALHWKILEPKEISDTCWKEMDDEVVLSKFDRKEFENQFQAMKEVKKVGKGGGGGGDGAIESKDKEEKKQETVNLLDPKRSYNINISLARFRMSHGKIRDAILQMDDSILDEERLVTLLNCVPTPEEVDSVMAYEGDESLLGEAEKFFRTVGGIPSIKERLELFLFKHRFAQIQEETEYNLTLCERAIKALRGSKSLKRVMEAILAFGNYLNGGTKKGQAHGFKLETLNKIKNTKSTIDPNLTLLHFLVETLNQSFSDATMFLHDLKDLPAASRVELNFLTGEVNKVNANVRKLERELKTPPATSADKFNPVMSEFGQRAAHVSKAMTERLEKIETASKELAGFFGEDPKSMPMEELFQTFSTFVQDYQKAMVYLEKRKEQEENNRKRKEAEEARKAAKQKRLTADEKSLEAALTAAKQKKEEPLVDKVVGALTGSSTQIRKMIQARRRKAGAVRRKTVRSSDGKEEEVEEEEEEEVPAKAAPGAGAGAGAARAGPAAGAAKETKGVGSVAAAAAAAVGGGSAAGAAPAAADGDKEGKKKGTKKGAGDKGAGGGKKKKKVWQKHIDPDSGDAYYYNTKTGASTWEMPPNFPYA